MLENELWDGFIFFDSYAFVPIVLKLVPSQEKYAYSILYSFIMAWYQQY